MSRRDTASVRSVRKAFTRRWKPKSPTFVIAAARHIAAHRPLRWAAWELIRHHEGAFAALDEPLLETLAIGLDSWDSVDAFGRTLTGAAWVHGLISDRLVQRWADSPDLWLRRLALVSTVALNRPAEGGRVEPQRTLDICERLVDDREDMVVKALSWSLRELGRQDQGAVRHFLDLHAPKLAARVKREVGNKLRTGLKTPRRTG